MNLNDTNIYKLLYTNNSVRDNYLKQLVTSNDDFFPKELTLDKFKRSV